MSAVTSVGGAAIVFVLLGVACSAPVGPRSQSLEASGVPGYQLGQLRVEGAPPIDASMRDTLARSGVVQGRLLDLDENGQTMLVATPGGPMNVGPTSAAPTAASRGRGTALEVPLFDVTWASYGPGGLAAAIGDEAGDERGRLAVARRAKPLANDVHAAIWDRPRKRLLVAAGQAGIDLWSYAIEGTRRRIGGGGGAWIPVDVASDGTSALVKIEQASRRSALARVDLATGATTLVTPADTAVVTGAFGPSGEVFAIGDAGRDRYGLDVFDARGRRTLVAESATDVTALAISGDRRTLAYTVTDDAGRSSLQLYDVANERRMVAVGVPTAGIADLHFAAGAAVVAFTFSDTTTARGAYRYDVDAQRGTYEGAALHVEQAVEPAHVAIASGDLAIATYVYKPQAERAPVVLELHGGPEDRWWPRYDTFAQALVAHGYALVRPDVRGSAGHGRAFEQLDDGAQRARVVDDVAAVLAWIREQPDLDAGRVTVMGTSYGGYLALASLIAFPDQLRGAIALGPITDIPAFLEGTAPYRRDHRRAEYGDERDPATRALLAKLSPIAHVAEIKRPILIAHGARDPRVPPASTDRFVAAARAAGARVWSLVAADEGHWFENPDNRAAYETLVLQFLAATP